MAIAPTEPEAGLSPWLQALGVNLGRLFRGGLVREYKSGDRVCTATPNTTVVPHLQNDGSSGPYRRPMPRVLGGD